MGRFLSTNSTPDQVINFTAAESIQLNDVVAIGHDNGKAYVLPDPSVSSTMVRGFSVQSKTWSQSKASIATALAALGLPAGGAVVKSAVLNNGNIALLCSTAQPNTYSAFNQSVAGGGNFGVSASAVLYHAVIDVNFNVVKSASVVMSSITGHSQISVYNNLYTGVATTGMQIEATPTGGYVVKTHYIAGMVSYIYLYSFSGAGAQLYSGIAATAATPAYAGAISANFGNSKMMVLPNGNIVLLYGVVPQVVSQQRLTFNLAMVILSPSMSTILAETTIAARGGGGSGFVGSFPVLAHHSVSMASFSNSGFAVFWSSVLNTVSGVLTRSLNYAVFNSGGAATVSPAMMRSLSYNSVVAYDGVTSAVFCPTFTDIAVHSCRLANDSIMVIGSVVEDNTVGVHTFAATVVAGGITASRDNLADVNGGKFSFSACAGGHAIAGKTHLDAASNMNMFADMGANTLVPYGSGAILIDDEAEHMISPALVPLAKTRSLGSCRMAQKTVQRFEAKPIIRGDFLTLSGVNSTIPQLPFIALAATTMTPGIASMPSEQLVTAIALDANMDGTTAVIRKVSGLTYAYKLESWIADYVQGMTFIGVAKANAIQHATFPVQVQGVSKLRIPFAKPMVIDLRAIAVPPVPEGSTTVLAVGAVVGQSNAFGNAATIIGDSITMKGLSA